MENSDTEKPKADYSKPEVLDEQIKRLDLTIRRYELQCCEELNRRRGMLEALTMIKNQQEIVSIQQPPKTLTAKP